MTRQVGVALGVACLVAILGTGTATVTAFHRAWIFMMGCGLVSGAVLQGIGARDTETADAGTVALDESYAVAAGR